MSERKSRVNRGATYRKVLTTAAALLIAAGFAAPALHTGTGTPHHTAAAIASDTTHDGGAAADRQPRLKK